MRKSWNAGKGVGMQLLTAQDPNSAACPCVYGTSRFMVMELEQAIDKAVEAVGLQSLKPLQRHVVCVTGMTFL